MLNRYLFVKIENLLIPILGVFSIYLRTLYGVMLVSMVANTALISAMVYLWQLVLPVPFWDTFLTAFAGYYIFRGLVHEEERASVLIEELNTPDQDQTSSKN